MPTVVVCGLLLLPHHLSLLSPVMHVRHKEALACVGAAAVAAAASTWPQLAPGAAAMRDSLVWGFCIVLLACVNQVSRCAC